MISRASGWALLSLLAASVLLAGFPAASPELRWAVAAALLFGLLGLAGPRYGVAATAFASTVIGGVAVLLGSAPLCPWPALVVLWFGAGFLFRQLAFSSPPSPSDGVTRALKPLLVLWLLASAAAALSARSLWALAHRLDLRIINGKGMTDAEALAGNLSSLAAVFAGTVLYGILRSLDSDAGRRALRGIVAGATASGLVALLQAHGWVASPRLPYWRMTGRFQGLCSDPNALGLLVGLAIPIAFAGGMLGARRVGWWLVAFALAAGLAESGSRSGFLVALGGSALVIVIAVKSRAKDTTPTRRTSTGARIGILAAVVLIGIILASDRRAGGLSQRLVSIFDRDVPLWFRASGRPVLWRDAWEGWKQNPIAGLGWNAFSWQRGGAAMFGYDNPGNFYLQMLTETGLAGIAIFLAFLAAAGRTVVRSLRAAKPAPPSPSALGAAAALAAFAVAMFFGSHLLAAEISCAAFVFLAQFQSGEPRSAGMGIGPRIALIAAMVAWGASLLRTTRPDEAFRYSDGIGFYAVEKSPESVFCWAGRRSAARLLPGERRRVRVVFRSPSEPTDLFRISSRGTVLFSRRLERDRPLRLVLIGPATRPAIVFLENSASFRPSASGLSPDSRDLSIQVFAEP